MSATRKMKKLLAIVTVLTAHVCSSQPFVDAQHFHSFTANNDSSFRYFMLFLNAFDATEAERNFWCEKASERIGDYYLSKSDYVKAIAYFDSADTKYRDKSQFCGNAHYIDFIPRRVKVSKCYRELNDLTKAISTLTPHIFGYFGSSYFDSTNTTYYISLLTSLYTIDEIKHTLNKAIDNIDYTTFYRWSRDSTLKYLNVSSKLKIFGSEIELRGIETSEENGKIPNYATKEFSILILKQMPIYNRLKQL